VKVVLDANVLFSAFVVQGTCAQVLEAVIAHHRLAVSEGIVSDVRRHLGAKVHASREELDAFEAAIRATAEVLQPLGLAERASRDPDDDAVLGLALAAAADILVTGDRDLLVLGSFRSIPIVSPRAFLGRFAHREPS
jgi:uncharacterized protein